MKATIRFFFCGAGICLLSLTAVSAQSTQVEQQKNPDTYTRNQQEYSLSDVLSAYKFTRNRPINKQYSLEAGLTPHPVKAPGLSKTGEIKVYSLKAAGDQPIQVPANRRLLQQEMEAHLPLEPNKQ